MPHWNNITLCLRRVTGWVTKAIFELTHNSFALVGVTVVFAAMAMMVHPELRQLGEVRLFAWLQERQLEFTGLASDLFASDRATASDPDELPRQQAAVAFWLSKKYRIAPEPLSALVAEAYTLGHRSRLDPTLILAVMAIESGFNPFAQSTEGAQGLMQVMTHVHGDKYQSFGGKFAAFDPLANLRVGVKVLQDCVRVAGSVEGGLKSYVGASNSDGDGGYTVRVLTEYGRLQSVAQGRTVAFVDPPLVNRPVLHNATVLADSAPGPQ